MDKKDFMHPEHKKEYDEAQVPLWFWNDKLEKSELEHQMKLMTDAGIACNAPHARTGFVGGYLDQEWMEHIKTVIEYKKQKGELLWIYDEFNWPAGTANGIVTKQEQYREKYLLIQKFFVPANTRFRKQPGTLRPSKLSNAEAMANYSPAKRKIQNLFCYDAKTGKSIDNSQFQPESDSGVLFSLAELDFEILCDRDILVYEARIMMEPFAEGGELNPDYLNSEATNFFVKTTYEEYYKHFPEAFGNVITASFNDETRFCHAFPWSDILLEEFERRKGYKLEEHLPELVIPGVKAGRTRCDYYDVIADLYRENYHSVIKKWCEEHRIDYCPHLLGEETMAGHVRFSGDFMRQIRAVSRPGVDHLGKGIGSLNIKFAASAAEVYGKRGLVCEVFAACGWDLTFEEYIRMISWLYSQGVQTITNHGFFYSIRDFRKNDWPPSQFFQWSGWDRMAKANAMCRRIYGMMSESVRQADVLVYHPVETFWLHYLADQGFTHGYHKGPIILDERAADIDKKEQFLLNGLLEYNIDYTVLPGDATGNFEIQGDRFTNWFTGLEYRSFILPMCEIIALPLAQLLDEFTAQGGRLCIIDGIPQFGLQKATDDEIVKIFERIMERPTVKYLNDITKMQEIAEWLKTGAAQDMRIISGIDYCKNTQLHYPDWLIDPYIHTGEDLDGVSWCKFLNGSNRIYYFINYTKMPQELVIEVASSTVPELWDTFTGEISTAPILQSATAGKELQYTIKIDLPCNYGVFLIAN
jgi:hypothetical protein